MIEAATKLCKDFPNATFEGKADPHVYIPHKC